MTESPYEAQRNLLRDIHDTIVDDPFHQNKNLSCLDVVQVMAAVLAAQHAGSSSDNTEKQHTD